MRHRFWADYTSAEFASLDRARIIAVLPIGAIEQHGPHLPLRVDAAIADGIAAAVIGRLPGDSPALFLPTMAIGKSDEHARYPGTLTLSAETVMQVWRDIGASVAASGVRKMVLMNNHGGHIAAMEIVARDLRIRHDMLVYCLNWWALGHPAGLYSEGELRHGIHAGDMETSVMRALHPDLVAMAEARDFQPLIQRMEAETPLLGLAPGRVKFGWQAQDMHPAGACGDATLATAAKGQATIDHAADRIVEVLAQIDATPLSILDQVPEW